jgi:hypothetical protein
MMGDKRMMMNWKGFGRECPWPSFKAVSRHLPGGAEENNENLGVAGCWAEI